MSAYYVYIVACNDSTLYVGSTTNIARRVLEHNESPLGAHYTKSRRPVHLVYSEQYENRSYAQKREYAIKSLTRNEKQALIATNPQNAVG